MQNFDVKVDDWHKAPTNGQCDKNYKSPDSMSGIIMSSIHPSFKNEKDSMKDFWGCAMCMLILDLSLPMIPQHKSMIPHWSVPWFYWSKLFAATWNSNSPNFTSGNTVILQFNHIALRMVKKLHRVLAVLSAIGLKSNYYDVKAQKFVSKLGW